VNSDGAGRFKINVPNSGAVLVFSFVGFVSKEVAVGSQSIINVILESDNKSLDEVVVVGYGTQKKANLTELFQRLIQKLSKTVLYQT
jgi:hypothetical protein